MIKISVKDLAYFSYGSGDLSKEFTFNNNSNEGKVAHKFLQNNYNELSESEVYIKHVFNISNTEVEVKGYIDGVIKNNTTITIEEIKSTKLELNKITKEDKKEYFVQAKLYAYLYMLNNDLQKINTRVKYINIYDYKTKSFNETLTIEEGETLFNEVINDYLDFKKLLLEKNEIAINTLKEIEFPFSNKRLYQQELMKVVYHYFKNKEYLYVKAPTGIGKTIATLFPALKTIEKNNEKIFYLTAKNTGKRVAVDSVKLLNSKNLFLYTTVISSKQKSCLLKQNVCETENCPYAKDFFTKLTKTIKEMLKNHYLFDEDIIYSYAVKNEICPFELSLYLSEYSDIIICDYNYCFDPKTRLIRYFEEDNYSLKVLVDEAHNFSDRAKEMYSETLKLSDILVLKEETLGLIPSISSSYKTLVKHLEKYKDLVNEDRYYSNESLDEELIILLDNLKVKLDKILNNHKEIENRQIILEKYFQIKSFLDMSEFFSEEHLFLVKKTYNDLEFKIRSLNSSKLIKKTIDESISNICFFSATLSPIDYHMKLITDSNGKYLTLPSPFDENNLNLIINDKISTRYNNREKSVDEIVKIVKVLLDGKTGNYIVFLPSYQYLEMLYSKLNLDIEIIKQEKNITEKEKIEILNKFKESKETKLGLFVLGGVFAEGMDFKGDMLSGVIVVGVGLPMINYENDLIKKHFLEEGFDYAYTYPGFSKVIQAIGRVIRTETDRGIAILIDDRFTNKKYQKLLSEYYNNMKVISDENILKNDLKEFWNGKK